MSTNASFLARLVANVRDAESLWILLRDGLDWPIQDPERATRRQTEIADGVPGGGVDVRRLRPLGVEDTRPVFLVEFERAYLRRDLRALLRSVRAGLREGGETGVSAVGDTLFIVVQPGYADVRFVLFRPRPSGAPEIRSFGWAGRKMGRTVETVNLPGLHWERREDWQSAFNVEGLTEDFYKAFERTFNEVKGEVVIQGMGGAIQSNDELNEARRHEWTQLLFNRLLFLAFVERMGWFKRPDGNATADYLHELYAEPRGAFRTYLGMLRAVFEELDTPDDDPSKGRHRASIGAVPYLNGGLFAPDAIDSNEIDLPDASFERILGGPEALFRRYNFTVTESSPLDQEVAVDPEMLGKIFERLVNDRHAEGKYYTPRPIVGFMVDEAIKGYLVEGDLSKEKASLLIDQERLRDPDTDIHIDADEVGPLRERLMAVRAVDPACGSGAYLLGLLQKLFNLVDLLNLGQRAPRDLYKTKLALLQRCIYGVDLDPVAVRIARLRLWLSLTVENAEGYKPEPLPNLDFRIESGDSLACPVAPMQPDLMRDRLIRDFRDVKLAYASAGPRERPALMAQANALREELRADLAHQTPLMAASRKPFDWMVEFAEVFVEEENPVTMDGRLNLGAEAGRRGQGTFAVAPPRPGGFDIVLANPPYVRYQTIKLEMGDAKKHLEAAFSRFGTGSADLSIYFFERAFQLLRPKGQLFFITPNHWLRNEYGEKLRQNSPPTYAPKLLVDFGDLEVFEGVAAYPLISHCVKGERPQMYCYVKVDSLEAPYPDMRTLVRVAGRFIESHAIDAIDIYGASLKIDLTSNAFRRLKDWPGVRINYGLLTGLNDAYYLTSEQAKEIISKGDHYHRIIKPVLRGRTVRRWRSTPTSYMIVAREGLDLSQFPIVMAHLLNWKSNWRAVAHEVQSGGSFDLVRITVSSNDQRSSSRT